MTGAEVESGLSRAERKRRRATWGRRRANVEILVWKNSDHQSLFEWLADLESYYGLLAKSPKSFENLSGVESLQGLGLVSS
jgi:hypothetical protein